MVTAPFDLSIAEAGRLVRDGSLSALALTEACLDRIDALNPALNVFITVTADEALAAAHATDERRARGALRGPLDGIPIALKDNCDTAGVRTTGGSALFAARSPIDDATCVRRLREAGAVIVGKTNLNELAHAGDGTNETFGAIRNPWDTDRSPGGSSGGSAAAVAAGLCLAALGTDTRGSVRIPAALCGVTGHRPSFGLVGRGGVLPRALTFDTVGPITRDALGAASVLAAISGPDPRDHDATAGAAFREAAVAEVRVAGLAIGVADDAALASCTDAVRARFLSAVEVLRGLGARLRPFALPAVDPAITARVAAVELASYLRDEYAQRPSAVGAALRRELEQGLSTAAVDYVAALAHRVEVAAACDALAGEFDAWITPTVAGTAWRFDDGERPQVGPFTLWPSAGHLPATSVLNGFDENGLPVALQIVAPRARDATCLGIAAAFQAATEFHRAGSGPGLPASRAAGA